MPKGIAGKPDCKLTARKGGITVKMTLEQKDLVVQNLNLVNEVKIGRAHV